MDERYDIIRSIFDGRYRYIRNFEPLKPYYQYMNTPEKGATMREIRRAEKEGSLTDTGKIFSTSKKPVEELYDFKNDPHEIRNLAGNPEHSAVLKKMRVHLAQWQSEIGDIGLIPEAEIEIREKVAGSRFEIMNGKLSNKNQVQRLVSIATKASEGPSVLGELMSAIADDDPIIRYWAVTGIGNIGEIAGGDALKSSIEAMKDQSPSVRIAAARAVARLGDADAALEVLKKELRSEHQWGRLAAAIVIDEMEESGRKMVKDLKEVLSTRQPNKYILRVVNRALNDLLGTDNKVP
jgi:uncharacterized sulfatase